LTNPYHRDQPVENGALFYGRDDALLWIEQQLLFNRRLLILYGPALIGKTALTRTLPRALVGHVACLYFSCQPHQGEDLPSVLADLAADIQQQLTAQGMVLSAAWEMTDDPVAGLTNLLQQAVAATHSQLLLVFDDAHALESATGDLTLNSFFDVLAAWLGAVTGLRLLVTLSTPAYHQLAHSLRSGAEVLRLGPLSSDAAQQLITRPAQGLIRFDAGAVKRIADITSNHPYYLHLFGYALFSRCARAGMITQADVDAVLEELLSQPNQRFQALWDESTAPERAALMAISGLKAAHGLVTHQEVVNYVRRFDPQTSAQALLGALEALTDREILVRMGASSYRFGVTLFRYWIDRHFEPASVLTQVDWDRPSARPGTGDEPEASNGVRRRWGVGHWVIGGLSSTALAGLALWALILTGTWLPQLRAPTPTAPPTSRSVAVSLPTATPTLTPIPLTPTPTNPVVITRTLPALVFRARNVGGSGDLPNWQIFVMNADGGNRQRITNDSYEDITPVWSPDGRRIAFVGRIEDNRDIYVMNLDGSGLANLTNHPANDWTPAWSPNGRQIVFSSNRLGYWELFSVNADGSDVRQIAESAGGSLSPVYSPDGQTIAFSGKSGDNWNIHTMPAPGTSPEGSQPQPPRQLTSAVGNELAPSFSPRGDRIAFETNRDGNYEIYVMNADGSNQRNLTNSPSSDEHGAVWSPDGKRILFYSNRTGNWDVFVMSDTGKNAVNLTNTPDVDEQEPVWRP
jgi:TolB protein